MSTPVYRTLLTLLTAITLAGCAATGANTDDIDFTDEDAVVDINWLTFHLQEEGVVISERGPVNLDVPADLSRRLFLNGRDVVDVYHFRNEAHAYAEAHEFAGFYPRSDVYLKDGLVVVRYGGQDSGLTFTMHKLLGRTL